mgnify:CR=1 FL=1
MFQLHFTLILPSAYLDLCTCLPLSPLLTKTSPYLTLSYPNLPHSGLLVTLNYEPHLISCTSTHVHYLTVGYLTLPHVTLTLLHLMLITLPYKPLHLTSCKLPYFILPHLTHLILPGLSSPLLQLTSRHINQLHFTFPYLMHLILPHLISHLLNSLQLIHFTSPHFTLPSVLSPHLIHLILPHLTYTLLYLLLHFTS